MLLEPIMKLEIVTPGRLSRQRHRRPLELAAPLIDKTFTRGKLMVVEARAPLEKMFGYSTSVRSLSQAASELSSMEPLEYSAAPDSLLGESGGG